MNYERFVKVFAQAGLLKTRQVAAIVARGAQPFPYSKQILWAAKNVLLAATISLLLSRGAYAQVDQGSISGTITDPTGAVVPGATVTLVNEENSLKFMRTANGSGTYVFSPLKVGDYTLEAGGPGFRTSKREHIRVDVSGFVGVNVKLSTGAVDQVVNVTTETALQTEDASTGQVFNQQQLNDAPIFARNYLFLAQITTGVNPPNQGNSQTSGKGAFSSNGSRVSQNNFILDGVDNNSNMQDFLNGATYAVLPPPDALEEVKIQSSNYSAELGRATGAAVNAAIKSGTNSIHGSLWEYFESDRLNALNFVFPGNTPAKTSHHQNIFGATLGGPILKNKLFIFADAQGARISNYLPPVLNQSVPTDLMRNGDFSEYLDPVNTAELAGNAISLYKVGGNVVGSGRKDPARYLSCPTATPGYTSGYTPAVSGQNIICPGNVNPVAQRILKLFPEPNAGRPHQVANNYTIPATAYTDNTTQYDVKVDFNPTAKDQAFARYSYSNNPTTYTPPLGILDGGNFGQDGQNSNYGKGAVVSETHFFSPNLSNEFRVGFNYLHASYLQVGSQTNVAAQYGLGGIPYFPTLGGFPDISFNGYINSIGIPSYMPSDEKQNVISFIDNVAKVLGHHTLKAGVNFQHVRFYGLQSPNPTGSESFTRRYTNDPADTSGALLGSAVADFLLDDMRSSSINSNQSFTNLRWYDGAFVQDDWKLRPNLTINLGLRWEFTQPFSELHDGQANFIGNFAGMNKGTGTLMIPQSQRNYAIPASIASAFASDNITVQYTPNRSLINADHHEFAPRIGFAYQPSQGTVVRSGFGFFYGGQENIGLGLNLYNNPPFFLNTSYIPSPNSCSNRVSTGIVCPTNGQTLETGFSGGTANIGTPTLYGQDINGKSSYTIGYNMSVQQQFTPTISFTLSYQGNQSRHLRVSYGANQYPGVVPSDPGLNTQLYQPFYDFGNIIQVTNGGSGNYNSLQAKLDKKFSHGVSFLAGYTWSHSLDDAAQPIQGTDGGTPGNVAFLGLKFQYGASATDVRNRFTFAPQYELPFGRGKKYLNQGGVVDALVGGWKSTAIFQVQTGTPIAFSGVFRASDPFAPGGTPSAANQLNQTCSAATKTLAHWFNPCAFSQAPSAYTDAYYNSLATKPYNSVPLSQAGTLPYGQGRVTLAGPGFSRLDMSLFKSFRIPIHESALELRADAFNVANTPSFSDPNNSITGTNAGSITSTRFSNVLPDARSVEVAARLTF